MKPCRRSEKTPFCQCSLALAFFIFAFVCHPAFAGGKEYLNDAAQFDYASLLVSEGDAAGGAREFQRLIVDFPLSPLVPRAQFNMAEALFKAGNIKDAEVNFRLFVSNFGAREPLLEAKAVRRVNEALVLKRRAGIPVVKLLPEVTKSEPLRAAQVLLFDGRGVEDVYGEMQRLGRSGVNAVIFRVFHNEGDRFHRGALAVGNRSSGVYFKSSHAPLIADILGDVTKAAHANGLKIFAWMTTRYADYGVEGRDELQCKGYDIRLGQLTPCKGLDLFNDDAVRRIEGIYSDLADYDIDGVLFQDDLVLKHNEGFGPYAAGLFKKDFGEDLRPEAMYQRGSGADSTAYTPLFWKWARWKNRRLLYVASAARAAVKKKRPDARFAINLMYESVSKPANSLAWLSQSLEAAVKEGFDYYSIMAYHRQMASELGKDAPAIKRLIGEIARDAAFVTRDASKVLVKFQTIDWTTRERLPNSEVDELIRVVKGVDGISLAVVPYRGDFALDELGGASRTADMARFDGPR